MADCQGSQDSYDSDDSYLGVASSSTAGACGDDRPEQEQLLLALEHNNLDEFRSLLRNPKVNPNHRYGKPHFGTCLEVASRRPFGRTFVKMLLERVRPNVNVIVPEPIHHAAKRGYDDVLEELLQDRRTKANAHDSDGRTALHYACMNVVSNKIESYKSCVRLLMARFKPADINRTDVNGFSAIHAAARYKAKRGTITSIVESVEEREVVSEEEVWKARYKLIVVILDIGRDILDIDSVHAMGRTAREDLLYRFPELEKHLPMSADPLIVDPHSALATALRDGRLAMLKALLKQTDDDGNPKLDPNHWFGVPLHATCLEMACKKRDGTEFVVALLKAGADPNIANKLDEKFPIHLVCEKALVNNLQALFDHSNATDPNSRDKLGNTALHYIVARWKQSDPRAVKDRRQCLEFLLSHEQIDVNRKNKMGKTALMLALDMQIKVIVQIIIEKKGKTIDLSMKCEDKEIGQIIQDTYPDLTSTISSNHVTFESTDDEWFHLLYNSREKEFVEKLKTEKPHDLSMNNKKFTLLQRAARYGMENAVKALLAAGSKPNECFPENKSPPAILAICNSHYETIKIFLQHENYDVNAVDSKGNTALYYAARKSDGFEIVLKLLQHGANPNIRNKIGKICFDREKLQLMLDGCVQTNDLHPRHEDYAIILDYRLLAQKCENYKTDTRTKYFAVPDEEMNGTGGSNEDERLSSEMDFLHIMSKNDELCSFLDHPIVVSFLQMKWNRVKILAQVNLGIYVLFVLFLNMYIISCGSIKTYFNYIRELNKTDVSNSTIIDSKTTSFALSIFLAIMTLVIWMYLLLREIVQFSLDQKKYFGSYENYLDWCILMFSFVAILMPVIQPANQLLSFINVLAIMLSCAELLVLLGRISQFAKYIEMLKVVVRNYTWPLMSYCIIVVAFGLSFHTLFHESHDTESIDSSNGNITRLSTDHDSRSEFGTWYMSIIKSLVMMTGKLQLETFSKHSFLSVVLFVFFVLLVTVVLLNLLIGLAVSDTQKIEADAHKLLLKTRIEVVLYAESILVNLHNADCWIFRKLTTSRKLRRRLRGAVLFPGLANEKRVGRVMPNHHAEIVLHDDSSEYQVDREWLERATHIISKRSGEKAEREVSLGMLYEKVDIIQKMISTRVGTVEVPRPHLNSLSLSDDISDPKSSSVFVSETD